MKPAIGQEWKINDIIDSRTWIINRISKYYCYGFNTLYTENFGKEITLMSLDVSGFPVWEEDWVYIGHPISCEDCYHYCGQKCK